MPSMHPTPTEVIEAWIPHDARWHAPARAAAREGVEALRSYITGLVQRYEDGGAPLTDDFDQRTIGAVREDLGVLGLSGVEWGRVRSVLLVPYRTLGQG